MLLTAVPEEVATAFTQYLERLERGVAKEIARIFLPQNLYTQAYWTVSLQGVIHFLTQRMKPDAQFEIQGYARGIHSLMADELERVGITEELLVGG